VEEVEGDKMGRLKTASRLPGGPVGEMLNKKRYKVEKRRVRKKKPRIKKRGKGM